MSAMEITWSSAISPERPPVPRDWHWAAGVALGSLILGLVSLQYAGSEELGAVPEEDSVIVSLGGQVQRLDPPPPEVETTDQAPVVAERAEDAPPPAAPVEPRLVEGSAQGDGRASSGTGAGASGPPTPLPPPAPAPPPPPRPTQVTQRFVDVSTRAYASQIIYPVFSLDKGEEGQGVLRVVVARDGRVIGWELVRSTGHRRLDVEIRRVAKLVSRLDPLPKDFAYDQTQITIPITFTIEYFDEE